jgi:tRNA(fMet)-specific endonuclease VapC
VYLLDTNVISEIAKNPAGLAAQRFASERRDMLCTSVIVSAEVLFGLRNGAVAKQTSKAMLAVLDYLHVQALEPKVGEAYAEIRAAMKTTGHSITPNDFFIAAHAITLDATLVTADQAFRFVPRLNVENWLRA